MELGKKIKELRTARSGGFTQSEVAEKLFTTSQNISRVESGDGEPTVEMLISLAELFGISLDSLVGRKSIYEPELFRDISDLAKNADKFNFSNKLFAIYKSLLRGRFESAIGEDTAELHQTYCTLKTKGLLGVFSDREDCPTALAAVKTDGFGFSKKEKDALTEFFQGFSSREFYDVLPKVFEVTGEGKLYDKESFCINFGVKDESFDLVITALENCRCVTKETIVINGEEQILYQPHVSEEAMILLQLAKLLLTCRPDGNA